MLRRPRRQQAGDMLVDAGYRAVSHKRRQAETPSHNTSAALAILLVDWLLSHSQSRVFLRNNPENTDPYGALNSGSQGTLIETSDVGRYSIGERGFRTVSQKSMQENHR